MFVKPMSLLDRLLAAAWTIFLITVLLWFAIELLARVWVWIVVISIIVTLVWVGTWVRRLRRELW